MSEYLNPEAYLPHRAPMLFVGAVEYIDENSVLCTSDVTEHGPFQIALADDGSLEGVYLFELMAQTIGVWAGFYRNKVREALKEPQSAEEADADVGMLLSIRGGTLFVDKVEKDTGLTVKMTKLFQDGQVATFEGSVSTGDKELSTGKITVYQPKQAELDKLFQIK